MKRIRPSRSVWIAISLFVAGALGAAGWFYWKNLRGSGPAFRSVPADIAAMLPRADAEDVAIGGPLQVPEGFRISIFADGVPGVRVIAQDFLGNFWLSRTAEGAVTLLEVDGAGRGESDPAEVSDGLRDAAADGNPPVGRAHSARAAPRARDVFTRLRRPHGLAFHPQDRNLLYIAEEHRIARVRVYTEDSLETIFELPTGGQHTTRTIGFGPDGRLYVSIGSSCNACVEKDPRRAAIWSMDPDGSDARPVAGGLRNAVFFAWSDVDGRMWATEMGRDLLGDHLPPDEINVIEEGGHYGWPWCYGARVPDPDLRNPASCDTTIPATIELPAHVAPLGLAFVPEEGWPEEYWYDLLVALHGSWNRTDPVGYKVVRVRLDAHGVHQGTTDFISGWLTEDHRALGRPVDILVRPGGVAYITDDKAGVVYLVERRSDAA